MLKDNTDNLKKLGSKETKYQYENPSSDMLEIFENQFPHRKYNIEFIFKEFTSLCPKTKQPDFATIKINYVPFKKCIETKSLKMYFLAFRNQGAFMETITNQILNDLIKIAAPRKMRIEAKFKTRGGIVINVTASYSNETI